MATTRRQVAVSRFALSRCSKMASRLRMLHHAHGALCRGGMLNVDEVALHYELGDGGVAHALETSSWLLWNYRLHNIHVPDREAWLVLKHDEPDLCDNGSAPPTTRPDEASLSFVVRVGDEEDEGAGDALDVIERIISMV